MDNAFFKTFTPSCYLFSWGGKKEPFMIVKIYFIFFNTTAASNILALKREKKIQAFYNRFSFAFSSNFKENTPILFNIMMWEVDNFFHDKNIILTAPNSIVCNGWNRKSPHSVSIMNASLSLNQILIITSVRSWLINKLNEMCIKMFTKKYISIDPHFLPCRYFLNGYFKCGEIKAIYM